MARTKYARGDAGIGGKSRFLEMLTNKGGAVEDERQGRPYSEGGP